MTYWDWGESRQQASYKVILSVDPSTLPMVPPMQVSTAPHLSLLVPVHAPRQIHG